MTSRFQDLYPFLLPDLPGIQTPLLLQTVQAVGREFARTTESWKERITMNIVDADNAYDVAYAAAIAAGKSTAAAEIEGDNAYDAALVYMLKSAYDAEIIRPASIWDSGDDKTATVDPYNFSFEPADAKLTLHYCPQKYSPVATAWATLTDYEAGDIVIVSLHRYLCGIAHTSGTWATDLAAGDWTLIPDDLLIDAVLVPKPFSTELAAWFMEKWSEAIVAGTMMKLCAMRNKGWSSPERVAYFASEYRRFTNLAMRENLVADKPGSAVFTSPGWTT
jgi:hypothetical protein